MFRDERQFDWSHKGFGLLEAQTVFPNGMIRYQMASPDVKIAIVRDNFKQEGKRVRVTLGLPPADPNLLEKQNYFRKAWSIHEGVAFFDPQQLVRIGMNMDKVGRDTLVLTVANDFKGDMDKGSPRYEKLTQFVYRGGLLQGCLLQAEDSKVFEFLRKADLQEKLQFLMGLPNIYSEKNRKVKEQQARSYKLRYLAVSGKDPGKIEDATSAAINLTDDLINGSTEFSKAKQLLGSIGWYEQLEIAILDITTKMGKASFNEVLVEIGRDAFLDEFLDEFLHNLMQPRIRSFIGINNLTDSEYQARRVILHKQAIGSESWRVSKELTQQYGVKLSDNPKEYHFLIDRKPGSREVSIACIWGDDDPRTWTVSLGLSLPVQDILDIYDNLDGDFRDIRARLGINFKRGS